MTIPFLGLNMIVKNESHIIIETLTKLCNKLPINYYVISDTGSIDNTKELITKFFQQKNIPGEIFDDEWSDFGTNRTLALQHAYKKTQYLLIHDADDEFIGNIELPKTWDYDAYLFQFGDKNGTSYHRVQLINNSMKWIYKGVLHEAIHCCEANHKSCILKGDYYTISGKSGARSKDASKYAKDASLLVKAFEDAKAQNDDIYKRYAFYAANSFFDSQQYEKAAEWYLLVLSQDNWLQEKYVSCLKLTQCYKREGKIDSALFYAVESFKYDTERCEGIFELIVYYMANNQYQVAFAYYSLVQDVLETKYLSMQFDNKLFIVPRIADFMLPYSMIIIAERLKKYETGIAMYEIIFKKRLLDSPQLIGNLLYNLQFFIEMASLQFLSNFQIYIDFLLANDYDLSRYDFLTKYKDYGIELPKIEKTNCSDSKNILIYTGYSNIDWNYSYSLSNALGGSESAVCYLAKQFPKDYKIFIAGQVKTETIDNISFVHLNDLVSFLQKISFHTIIVSRYVGFFDLYPYYNSHQTLIWAHDIILLPYGSSKSVGEILKTHDSKIKACICQTAWHKELFLEQYPELSNKITIINNGIPMDLLNAQVKIKDTFIYSSCTERGLDKLLQLWPVILNSKPNAQLFICCYNNFPVNESEKSLVKIIQQYPSIQHLGKLNKTQLYSLMGSVEYWMYPTDFKETSCITALEMLASKVICFYYPIAGLVDTLGDYGIRMKRGKELESLLQMHDESKKEFIKERGYAYAKSCSWSQRALQWFDIIFDERSIVPKVISLERRKDRRLYMEEQFEKVELQCEFINAVDGDKLLPTEDLRLLFNQNDFNYKRGVLGCALSHLKLWKQLAFDNKNEYYIILEDDVELCPKFGEKLAYIVEKFVQQDIEHLALGEYNTSKPTNKDTQKLKIIPKDPYQIWNVTFAYIISKKAAQKLIKVINTCSIKSAIDNVQSYGYVIRLHTLNETLVNGKLMDSNPLGTNVHNGSCLTFKHVEQEQKILKRIAFCDWWNTEYCGGIFDPKNNFFTRLLIKYANGMEIQIVKPTESPDILIYSVFGDQHKSVQNCRKIFYCGEPFSQRREADLNLTFDYNDINNIRLPLWLCYMNKELILQAANPRVPTYKTKFCSFIASGPGLENNRKEFIDKLSAYKKVDCGGNYLNNIGYQVPLGLECSGKIAHNNDYKFGIAFESKNFPGYVTEKICDLYKSQCIPIYWGTCDVVLDFDPSTFINANDFPNWDALIEHVKKVDTDRELYASYFKKPFFSRMWMDIFKDPQEIFVKNLTERMLGLQNNLIDNAFGTKLDFVYGSEEAKRFTIVSEILYKDFLAHTDWIYIPAYKNEIFGDPCYGIVKQIFILQNQEVIYKVEENDYAFINFKTQKIIVNEIPDISLQQNDVWIFYGYSKHNFLVLEDYIKGLKSKYNIKYTKDKIFAMASRPSKISFVMFLEDFELYNSFENTNTELSFLNTEPLSSSNNLEIVKKIVKQYPNLKIYDYSRANIEILTEIGVQAQLLEYICTKDEISYLSNLYQSTPKTFDYGYITYGNTSTNNLDSIVTLRRKKVVAHLMERGFSVHIISGWGHERDVELAKCKTILNIHSTNSKNFEHIRCDRLLAAGFNILSEESIGVLPTENLKLIPYHKFFQGQKYCFIHSCTLPEKGTKRLEHLVLKLKHSGILDILTKVFIYNIGLSIENTFGEQFIVENLSENPGLHEIPTINKICEFSQTNPNCYVLYIHTKGVRWSNDYQPENDWIDMMIYFLIENYKECIYYLDKQYDCVGCNFVHYRPHFSGNFWWTNTNYAKNIAPLCTKNIQRNEAEFWIFYNQPYFISLHNSGMDHYKHIYPRFMYQKWRFFYKAEEITHFVYTNCIDRIEFTVHNVILGDPCFNEHKFLFTSKEDQCYKENTFVKMLYDPNVEFYYGTETKKQNVTDIVKILGCVSLKINCESKLTIVNHLNEKYTYDQGTTIFIDLIAKNISVKQAKVNIPIFYSFDKQEIVQHENLQKNVYMAKNSTQDYKKSFFAITGYFNGWTHYYEILKNACIPYFLHYKFYPPDVLDFLPCELIKKTNLFCESGCSSQTFVKDYNNYLEEWLLWAKSNLTTTQMVKKMFPVLPEIVSVQLTEPSRLSDCILAGLQSLEIKVEEKCASPRLFITETTVTIGEEYFVLHGNCPPIYQTSLPEIQENPRQFLFPLYNNYLQNFQSLLEIGPYKYSLSMLWKQLYSRVDTFFCNCLDTNISHETDSNIIFHDETNLVDIHYLQKTFSTMRLNTIIVHSVTSLLVIFFVLENYSKLLGSGDVIILEAIKPEAIERIKAFIPQNFKQYENYGTIVLVKTV